MRRSRRRFQSCTGDTCIAQSDAAEVYTVALHQPRHNLSGLDPRQARHGPRNHSELTKTRRYRFRPPAMLALSD